MPYVTLAKSVHPFASNTYIIYSGGECAVVDPSVPYSTVTLQGKLRYILLTHAHFDHMLDIDEWVRESGATVIVSAYDKPALSDSSRNAYFLFTGKHSGYFGESVAVNDGDTLPLGDELIRVIALPGHTPGSVGYHISDILFAGDTVFSGGGYGRCDLPGGDYEAIKDSINRVMALEPSTILLCGHGEATTVSEYRRYYRNF